MAHNLPKTLLGCRFQGISCLQEAFGTAGEDQTCQSQQDDIFFLLIYLNFISKKYTQKQSHSEVQLSRHPHISFENQHLTFFL